MKWIENLTPKQRKLGMVGIAALGVIAIAIISRRRRTPTDTAPAATQTDGTSQPVSYGIVPGGIAGLSPSPIGNQDTYPSSIEALPNTQITAADLDQFGSNLAGQLGTVLASLQPVTGGAGEAPAASQPVASAAPAPAAVVASGPTPAARPPYKPVPPLNDMAAYVKFRGLKDTPANRAKLAPDWHAARKSHGYPGYW